MKLFTAPANGIEPHPRWTELAGQYEQIEREQSKIGFWEAHFGSKKEEARSLNTRKKQVVADLASFARTGS